MAADQVQRIVDRLLKKTTSRDLEWEKTANLGVFQVALTDYTVLIEHIEAGMYILTIVDGDGIVIEHVRPVDLAIGSELSQIYDGARRTALNVEEALNDLLEELGG